MDIGSNELTRPFRIPRITRHDAKEEAVKRRPPPPTKRLDAARQTTALEGASRSPLAAPTKSRPSNERTSSSYGQRIVPAVKRKATSSTEAQEERRFKSGIPIDDIMQHMIMPTSKHTGDALSDTGSARSLPRVPTSNESGLTRERLERHAARQECHTFAEKGLMEALLEQKMKTGRIEAHTHMGYVRRATRDPVPPVEDVEERTPVEPEPEQRTPQSPPRRGPRTPPGSPPLRRRRKPKGPATPSDSPPAPSSSNSYSASFRGRSDESVNGCSPSPSDVVEPVAKRHRSSKKKRSKRSDAAAAVDVGDAAPTTSADQGGADRADLMEQIAAMAGVPVAQLRKCLDAEFLNALKGVDQAMLLATVKTVLSSIAKSKPPPSSSLQKVEQTTPEVSSSMSPTPRAVNRSATDNAVGYLVNDSNDETVEMELDSNEGDDLEESVPPPPLPPTSNELGLPPPDPVAPPPPLPPPPPPRAVAPQSFYPRPPPMQQLAVGQQPNQVQIIQTLLQALAIPNSLQQQQQQQQQQLHQQQHQPPQQHHQQQPQQQLHASFVSSPPAPPVAVVPAPPFHEGRQYSTPPQPPPMCRPPRPLSPYSAFQAQAAAAAAAAAAAGPDVGQRRPPGGQIVNDRSESPVLLDRYGMPLPIPSRMRSVESLPPPPPNFTPDHRPYNNSNSFGGFSPNGPPPPLRPPQPPSRMPPPIYPEYPPLPPPGPVMDRRPGPGPPPGFYPPPQQPPPGPMHARPPPGYFPPRPPPPSNRGRYQPPPRGPHHGW